MENILPVTAWSASRPCGSVVCLHSHDYYELVFYRAGAGEGRVAGRRYSFSDGDFLLLSPGVPHDERHFLTGEVFCLGFKTAGPVPIGLFHDGESRILSTVRAILSEVAEQKTGFAEMLSLMLNELLLRVRRLAGGAAPQESEKDFAFAAAYLVSNCHEKISLPALAAEMNLSYDYFRHRFRLQTGFSPKQYLIRARVALARKLLAETALSCTEIAGRCGFSDSAQFAMFFKRETSLTPRQFRKEATGERGTAALL